MKKVLIFGASGALGRAVVNKMMATKSFKIFSAGRQGENTETSLFCDFTNKEQLLDCLAQVNPDIVINLVATLSNNLEESYTINVQPSRYILDFIKDNKLKTRLLLIGSAAEYGAVEAQDNPVAEDHALAPVSVYGLSKSWQTQLVSLYSQDVDVLCARVFNLYGEGISEQLFAGTIQQQIKEVLSCKKQNIKVGSLSAIRDYISTLEAADQLLKIMEHGKTGELYNVASGNPITMRDFAKARLEEQGLDLSVLIEEDNKPQRQSINVPIMFADMTKTNKLIKELI